MFVVFPLSLQQILLTPYGHFGLEACPSELIQRLWLYTLCRCSSLSQYMSQGDFLTPLICAGSREDDMKRKPFSFSKGSVCCSACLKSWVRQHCSPKVATGQTYKTDYYSFVICTLPLITEVLLLAIFQVAALSYILFCFPKSWMGRDEEQKLNKGTSLPANCLWTN